MTTLISRKKNPAMLFDRKFGKAIKPRKNHVIEKWQFWFHEKKNENWEKLIKNLPKFMDLKNDNFNFTKKINVVFPFDKF